MEGTVQTQRRSYAQKVTTAIVSKNFPVLSEHFQISKVLWTFQAAICAYLAISVLKKRLSILRMACQKQIYALLDFIALQTSSKFVLKVFTVQKQL